MDTMKGREQNPNSGRTGGSPEEKLDEKQTEFPLRRKGTRRDGSGTKTADGPEGPRGKAG